MSLRRRAGAVGAGVLGAGLLAVGMLGVAALGVAALGCGDREANGAPVHHEPEGIADQEDAVCGMSVRAQTAPRGQVVHRDGTRFFFCSIGDLLVHLSAPSPHGRVEASFVEVLDPTEAPAASHTGPHPWSRTEDASFVVGVPRAGIMGEPVLVYADAAAAERVVDAYAGARMLAFDELRRWWDEAQAD